MYDGDFEIESLDNDEPEHGAVGESSQAASASRNLSVLYTKEDISVMIKNDDPKLTLTSSGTKSKAWNDYYLIEIDNKIVPYYAACKLCKLVLGVPKGTNTTLHRHATSHKKAGLAEDQSSITSFMTSSKVSKSTK